MLAFSKRLTSAVHAAVGRIAVRNVRGLTTISDKRRLFCRLGLRPTIFDFKPTVLPATPRSIVAFSDEFTASDTALGALERIEIPEPSETAFMNDAAISLIRQLIAHADSPPGWMVRSPTAKFDHLQRRHRATGQP
jgi:hypothetical protein